jgi:uncharacterized protein YndB with AHSA1/START domain
MPRIEEHMDIAVPRSDLFRFCHDVERRPEWDERIEQMTLLTATPIRRGTLFRVDARPVRGPVFSWEGEYVDYQYLDSSTVRVIDAAPSSHFKAGREKWRFSSTNGQTKFTLLWEYEVRGFLARILDVLGRRAAIQRAVKQSLINLKELVETTS